MRTGTVLALLLFLIARSPLLAEQHEMNRDDNKAISIVVHNNDGDTEHQKHGLKNVQNFLKELKGEATVEVVSHGSGMTLVLKDKSSAVETINRLRAEGVKFVACANTLKEKNISEKELLDGISLVPSGAVEVVRLQQNGYSYFKP